MRLSTDEDRDEDLALETITAAATSGVTVFDTARSYGRDETELGHNERLLAGALRRSGTEAAARIVTKGGMSRAGGAWVPDARAKTIRADCEASLAALDGLPVDLYLIHAPDPRTPWRTSLRALARLVDEELVRRVGVANVNRLQLDEALDLAPIAAVQVALSVYDDSAVRGGVVERCAENGITLIAHTPLGGPRRAARLSRRSPLAEIAEARDASAAEIALAWLLELSPAVVAIPGARRPETARSSARAAKLRLDEAERDALSPRPARPARLQTDAEVVLVMGIPGAGKSLVAEEYVARGYLRLNRDERGGTLRDLAQTLDGELASGASRVVLDNTYLSRASRSYVIEAAGRHGVQTRCVWVDTPLAQAQVNLVERLLERLGTLPTPEELRALARREPGIHAPTSQMRAVRELEPPAADEGFAAIEQVPFTRAPAAGGTKGGVFVAAAVLRSPGWEQMLDQGDREAPHLVFDWAPDGSSDALAPLATSLSARVSGPVETAVCAHGGGPPSCWCRPPLPGLQLAYAREQRIDPSRSILIGSSPAHRTLARTLGARYLAL